MHGVRRSDQPLSPTVPAPVVREPGPMGHHVGMQATVASFSVTSHEGTVLLDDGSELPFGAAPFDASGLRLLRPGQRVALRVDGDRVVALTLATFALP